MTLVRAIFDDIEEDLRRRFSGVDSQLRQPGEKGAVREERARNALCSTLPGKLGVGAGIILNKDGAQSPQVDVVIYDAIDGAVFHRSAQYSVFPCESVYATIEVKSVLSASDPGNKPDGTLWQCCERITRIKALHPSSVETRSILCTVLAYSTMWKKDIERTLVRWVDHFGGTYQKSIPDLILVLDPGFLVWCPGPTGYYNGANSLGVHWKYPLMEFVSRLVRLPQERAAKAPNLWFDYGDPLEGGLQQGKYRLRSHPPRGI